MTMSRSDLAEMLVSHVAAVQMDTDPDVEPEVRVAKWMATCRGHVMRALPHLLDQYVRDHPRLDEDDRIAPLIADLRGE